MSETVIACDFTKIDEKEVEPHKKRAEKIITSVQKVEELVNGYSLNLPNETKMIEEAGMFIARERLCCPFLHFSLDVEPNRGEVWLKISGNDNVKGYLEKSLLPLVEENLN